MFICDTHCDTVSELYKNDVDFFANKQHIDVERIIKNGGGLQFCALFIPTEQFRYYGGIRYTLTLLDKYKTELKKLAARGVDVHPILTGPTQPQRCSTNLTRCWPLKKAAPWTAAWLPCACSMNWACGL